MLDKIFTALTIIKTVYEWLFPKGRYKKTLEELTDKVETYEKNKDTTLTLKQVILHGLTERGLKCLNKLLEKKGYKKKNKK